MDEYTIVNLTAVEDQAPKFGVEHLEDCLSSVPCYLLVESPGMNAFDDLRSIRPLLLSAGYLARAVHGGQLTLAVVEVEPGAELPEHRHANEQLGMVIEGSVVFRIADETRTVEAGGIWRIPSDTPHAVTGGDAGAVVVDVFSPPRDDWAARERMEPRPSRWP